MEHAVPASETTDDLATSVLAHPGVTPEWYVYTEHPNVCGGDSKLGTIKVPK